MGRTRPPCCARAASGHAVAPSPAMANLHLAPPMRGPCEGALSTQHSTAPACGPYPWEGLPNRLLHCGISVVSADGFMAEMGHVLKCSG
jgi:hypothetical protein